jgi:hypothetical protein
MKRALLGLAMVISLAAANGCTALGPCSTGNCPDGSCGIDGHAKGRLGSHHAASTHPRLMALRRHMEGPGPHDGMYGPPSAAIAYPYYTTRAPRDYFEPAPPTIGR